MLTIYMGFPGGTSGKESTYQCRRIVTNGQDDLSVCYKQRPMTSWPKKYVLSGLYRKSLPNH